jgi:hypothetical protein
MRSIVYPYGQSMPTSREMEAIMIVRFDEEDASGTPIGICDSMVNQQVLMQNKYLIVENRILRAQLPSRLRLTHAQQSTLAKIGKRLGRGAPEELASAAKPETILGDIAN